jgi:pullulanase
MKKVCIFIYLVLPFLSATQELAFDTYPVYDRNDLGLTYQPGQSAFRIWAPAAEKAELRLYREGMDGQPFDVLSMRKSGGGVWLSVVKKDLEGIFYTFRVQQNGVWLDEVPDPYSKSVGMNGKRAMVFDPGKTNPAGWEKDRSPGMVSPADAIIYELHIRDASIALNSGIVHKGKYLGLAETGTKNPKGLSTGLDHLKELGVTHIHLLPFYDFMSVDERRPELARYNWGYDPLNYNVPEGSYATNAKDGISRIRELKTMIQAFHSNGLNVVMDIVFNHTMLTEDSYFNQLVPGYYYRHTKDGKFSNATACGNETASERPMMRKFMLESLLYWVREYHIDGFRFDLMGVHDIETMNLIASELRKVKPDILLYGEGWTAGASPYPEEKRALKRYAEKLDGIAVFSDDMRDGIKGSVFRHDETGFASGRADRAESVRFGIAGGCRHPQIKYEEVNYSKAPYVKDPTSTITYADCHDNHVLWDKLVLSTPAYTDIERREMYKLALGIVLSSQGIPFLHAGSEFIRTKNGHENSFNAGDSINAIDWNLKSDNYDVYLYCRELIRIRKTHPAFRMKRGEDVAAHIRFIDSLPPGLIGYTINGTAIDDSWKKIRVYLNGDSQQLSLPVRNEEWRSAILNNAIGKDQVITSAIMLAPFSCTILYQAE